VKKLQIKSIFDDDFFDDDNFWVCTKCKKVIPKDQRHGVITVMTAKRNKPYHWHCYFEYVDKKTKKRIKK